MPGEGRAVVIRQRVARLVVGNGVAVIGRQQIPPLLVSVGVGVGRAAVAGRQQIAYRVVCIGVGFLERSAGIVNFWVLFLFMPLAASAI